MGETTRLLLRGRGLALLLLVEAAGMVAGRILPEGDVTHAASTLFVPLLWALCILAGYDLRTRWALLVTPLVAWGSLIVYFILMGIFNLTVDLRADPFMVALFLLAPSIPFVLLAQLGVWLGKRGLRSELR
jgi:hypothetical protein